MVSNNEIRDSLILEENTAQKENERKQLEQQIKPENTLFKRRPKRIVKLKKNKKKRY